MAGWLVDLLISESNHRILAVTAIFRFRMDYVNYPFSKIFRAVLHNQHLQGVGGDVVITYISTMLEIRRFGHKL